MRPFVLCLLLICWLPQAQAASFLRPIKPKLRQSIIQNHGALLKRGALMLIEQKQGRLQQITIMRWVKAPIKRVFPLIAKMENYPKLLQNVQKVKIVKRKGSSYWAKVTAGMAMLKIGWTTKVDLHPPHRIEMLTTGGDVSKGGWSWRLHSVGPKKAHTVVFGTFVSTIDRGSWVMQWMLKNVPSMPVAMNVGAGLSFVEAMQRKAEGKPDGGRLRKTKGRALWKLRPMFSESKQLRSLMPLLGRGDLALIESFPDGTLRQVNVLARFQARVKKVRHTVSDIRSWGRWLKAVRRVSVRRKVGNQIDYRIRVKLLPFYSLKTRHRMFLHDKHIDMKVLGGSIKRARYKYHFYKVPKKPKASVFVYSLYIDLRSTNSILRGIFAQNKEVEHGVTMASAVIWVNALRKRVERR